MKILVVKTSSLGDIVHALVLLDHLEGYTVDWVVESRCAAFLEGEKRIRRLFVIDTPRWKKKPFAKETWGAILTFKRELQEESYDWVLDPQGNSKSALITLWARGRRVGFGRQNVLEWPNLLVTDQKVTVAKGLNVREEILSLLGPLGITPALKRRPSLKLPRERVFVAATSNWPNKMLHAEELAKELHTLIKEPAHWTFSCAGERERAYVDQVLANLPLELIRTLTLLDRPPFALLREKLLQQDLVVGVDSFVLHLAGQLGCPTFGFFGPSSAQKFAPLGHEAVQAACPYGIRFERRCPKLRSCPTGACLKHPQP